MLWLAYDLIFLELPKIKEQLKFMPVKDRKEKLILEEVELNLFQQGWMVCILFKRNPVKKVAFCSKALM